jgi:hypothetical protein
MCGHRNGWSFQDDKLALMANDVVAKGYAGFFYWSNVDQAASVAAYMETYPLIHANGSSLVRCLRGTGFSLDDFMFVFRKAYLQS